MMAESGENTGERPMWAEKGGLDFDGRARWDAWTALKGMKPDRAKLQFVRVSPQFMCCGQKAYGTGLINSQMMTPSLLSLPTVCSACCLALCGDFDCAGVLFDRLGHSTVHALAVTPRMGLSSFQGCF